MNLYGCMSDTELNEAVAWYVDGCSTCTLIRDEFKGFGPSHNGRKSCESGSIAAGGTHDHCSCDTCF